ncbi:hypothetical protein BE20_04920 [Sorangium cellulosum]|uniref:DUF4265 domain-containing protein n=2 Tax=Sorangium TaxID=39643 RepID=A0A150RB96_SORCE|nr:hypothetical protein BE18_43030 [Sorangium cellulosum]KYF94974.1 hypothetical protein BE20_04920 [Sorangium cellulosum]
MQPPKGFRLMGQTVKVYFRLVQDEDGYPPVAVESVWAQPTTRASEFVLDNLPFFAREATLGDTVLVREEDGHLWFEQVVHRSRNSLVRVVFFDRACVERVNNQLVALGCSTEYIKAHNLLAASIPENVNLRDVQDYLQAEASEGAIDYEEPILRQ